jgi:hypothetical protein
MELITFKTNIKSEDEVCKVAPYLSKASGSNNWQIELSKRESLLTVYSPGIVQESQIVRAVLRAGFMAIKMNGFCTL